MIDAKRKNEAQKNFRRYLDEGLLVKQTDILAKNKYVGNAELSLRTAQELMQSSIKPHLWVIVTSYYSMFYMANAVLLHLGYKTQEKIVHKVTSDALIVLVLHRLKKGILEHYESAQKDAMELASIKAEEVIQHYDLELEKRSTFQY